MRAGWGSDTQTPAETEKERERHRSREQGRQEAGAEKARGCQEPWAKEQAQKGTFSARDIKS